MLVVLCRLLLQHLFRSEPKHKLRRWLLRSDDFEVKMVEKQKEEFFLSHDFTAAMEEKQMEEFLQSLSVSHGKILIQRKGSKQYLVNENGYNARSSLLHSNDFQKAMANKQLRELLRSLTDQECQFAHDNCPEQVSCYIRAIQAILKKFPEFVAKILDDADVDTDVDDATQVMVLLLKERAPLSVIEEVHELLPNDALPAQLLHVAIRCNNPVDVISFLLSKNKNAVFEVDQLGNLPIKAAVAEADYRGANETASVALLQVLTAAHPEGILEPDLVEESALSLAIRRGFPPSLLDVLAVEIPKGTHEVLLPMFWFSTLDTLIHVLSELTSEHRLKLHIMESPFRPNDLTRLMRGMGASVVSVALKNCRCLLEQNSVDFCTDWSSSSVETFAIHGSKMAPVCLVQWLLPAVGTLPNLKSVRLISGRSDYKVTPFVIHLLRNCQTLKSLRVRGHNIDAQRVLNTLTDPSLTSTCIVDSEDLSSHGLDRQVRYYSTLNHYGRYNVSRGNDATSGLLIKCVLAVQADPKVSGLIKTSVVFGLLRQSPSLWTS